jgi:hypothetical protein
MGQQRAVGISARVNEQQFVTDAIRCRTHVGLAAADTAFPTGTGAGTFHFSPTIHGFRQPSGVDRTSSLRASEARLYGMHDQIK